MRTIQHKRGLRANLPAIAQPGELLLALDTQEVFYGASDNSVKRLTHFVTQDVAPTPSEKLVWLDTTNNELKIYKSGAWALFISPNSVIDDAEIALTTTWSSTKIDAELDGKSDVDHTHVAVDITDFDTAADARITAARGVANGIAPLNADGVVPLSYLPTTVKETKVKADIAARDAIASPYEGLYALVLDASADPTVESGAAGYFYVQGTGWKKTFEAESLDIVLDWSDIQSIPQAIQDTTVGFTQVYVDQINAKAKRPATFTAGNLLMASATGDPVDSGQKWSNLDVIDGGTF